ncbi:RICIN domain-containing protein [Kitasatospora sp. NPDC004723]|uniref:RICIN domain-containing protein n=1 Tax=Kitasatospora sp. NPDC004723 TaxID=3154288 RepID=UPI0033AA2E2E
MRKSIYPMLAAALSLAPIASSTPAHAQTYPAVVVLTLTAAHSGKCLDVAGKSAANGADLVQATCDGSPSQKFTAVRTEASYEPVYRYETFSGKCLDSGSGAVQFPLKQQTCNGGWSQKFQTTILHSFDPGVSFLTMESGRITDKCWHVKDASLNDGAPVIVHKCNYPGSGVRNDLFTL